MARHEINESEVFIKELGETFISREQRRANVIGAFVAHFTPFFLASVIWALALGGKLWILSIGIILGILGGIMTSRLVAQQPTKERAREMVFAGSLIWVNVPILLVILGVIVWIISTIF